MEKKEHNLPKDISYYLTLFKIEGHRTWRAHLSGHKDGFDQEQNSVTGGKRPKVTEKVTMRIDRITGTFAQN